MNEDSMNKEEERIVTSHSVLWLTEIFDALDLDEKTSIDIFYFIKTGEKELTVRTCNDLIYNPLSQRSKAILDFLKTKRSLLRFNVVIVDPKFAFDMNERKMKLQQELDDYNHELEEIQREIIELYKEKNKLQERLNDIDTRCIDLFKKRDGVSIGIMDRTDALRRCK